MDSTNSISGINASQAAYSAQKQRARLLPTELKAERAAILDLGQGEPVGADDASRIVYERALERLRQVVDTARAELGLKPGDTLDTSSEATANRIADFALSAFDAFRANHNGLDEEQARVKFVDLIRPAIQQGIDEAKGILGALSALSPEVESQIGSISELITQRLDCFLSGN